MSHDHSERSTSTEKVPHSGRLPEDMRETPVREFDNTPLLEAHEQGLLEAPDSATDIIDTDEIPVRGRPTEPIQEASPNRRGMSSGAKKATAITTLVATALGGALYFGFKPSSDTITEHGQGNEQTGITPEAQEFINEYEGLFSDPLATYYSLNDYEARTGRGLMLQNSYIDSYDFDSTVSSPSSPLGFDTLLIPIDANIDRVTAVDQFNSSIESMNRLMNMLAKNPTPEQTAVIIDEFVEYSGYHNSNAQKLVDLLHDVVNKYGSNSAYSINTGTANSEASTDTSSVFLDSEPIIDALDETGKPIVFNSMMSMSINITTHDRENRESSSTEVLTNIQFSVSRAPVGYDPLAAGYVGIGLQGKGPQ